MAATAYSTPRAAITPTARLISQTRRRRRCSRASNSFCFTLTNGAEVTGRGAYSSASFASAVANSSGIWDGVSPAGLPASGRAGAMLGDSVGERGRGLSDAKAVRADGRGSAFAAGRTGGDARTSGGGRSGFCWARNLAHGLGLGAGRGLIVGAVSDASVWGSAGPPVAVNAGRSAAGSAPGGSTFGVVLPCLARSLVHGFFFPGGSLTTRTLRRTTAGPLKQNYTGTCARTAEPDPMETPAKQLPRELCCKKGAILAFALRGDPPRVEKILSPMMSVILVRQPAERSGIQTILESVP